MTNKLFDGVEVNGDREWAPPAPFGPSKKATGNGFGLQAFGPFLKNYVFIRKM